MTERELILKAIREAHTSLNEREVSEHTKLDREVVDETMDAMKKDGCIVPATRCRWRIA